MAWYALIGDLRRSLSYVLLLEEYFSTRDSRSRRVRDAQPGARPDSLDLPRHGHPQPDAPQEGQEARAHAPEPLGRPATDERGGSAHIHPQAQEAQLGQPQVLPRQAERRPGSRLLHPGGGPQPAGAPRGAGAGRPHPGPAWRQAYRRAGQV